MKTDGRNNDGFVMTGVLMLLLIAALVGGSFLFSARSSFAVVDQWRVNDECLLGLQSGLERRKYSLDTTFRTNYNYSHSWNSLDELENLNTTAVEHWTNHYSINPHVVTVTVVTTSGSVIRDVTNYTAEVTLTNIATATHEGMTRRVREVIRYRYASSQSVGGGDRSVFDNVFFIDNIGFFSGVNADFNGDVRANLDVDLRYTGSLHLNGDSYAGGINTSHQIYKNFDWDDYGDQEFSGIFFGDRVRPAEYTDYDRGNTNTYWPQGYDEVVNFYDGVEELEMPFIGPLSEYEDYAKEQGGTVSDSNTTVVAVWGDDEGEDADGIGTNVSSGCLVLIGTESDPININGIVVAQNDIYIKGYFTGQGTLYAGRNIHIIGDLIAVDPPTWPKPDSDPYGTAATNKFKDFIGLCAKGSMVFGDHTSLDTSLLKSPHTASHATDASDASLGYVSYYSSGVPYFDGDYTQPDGNGLEIRSDGSARHFFEPILSNADMTSLGMSSWVGWFDAVLYANHLIAGEFDSNAVLNGGFVCRDEAVRRHGNLALNWDIRLGASSVDGMGFAPWLPGMLPRQTTVYQTVKWTEISAQ